jgi:hypothetical protein
VHAGRDLLLGADVEALDAEQVVAIAQPAVLEVQRPAADAAALGDDHPLRAALGHLDLRRHGVRLVLDADDRVLRQASHTAVQPLAVPLHEHRPPCDLGDDPLRHPVVEREDVVLRRLDQEQALEVVEPLRLARREILELRPVGLVS